MTDDSSIMSTIIRPGSRQDLVVQRKKVNEVYQWFNEHFVTSSIQEYSSKCPFLILQGPTGCGKTATLKSVASELKIPVKEYSETTDTTAISYDLARCDSSYHYEDDRSLDKRRAQKFEHFVINHLRFNPLYPPLIDGPPPASADSEFDSDDDLPAVLRPPSRPVATGVIIHIEAPLSFAKSQKILMSTMAKMIKTVREIARTNPRRVAIVFENLECEKEVISLPTKFKQTIGMQTIKFNPIIRTTMKKFIELRLRNHSNIIMENDAIELLINDCDGDLRACANTLQLLSNRVQNHSKVFTVLNDDDFLPHMNNFQVNKKQRLNPDRFKLNTSLMRDVTRSLGFFHTLGKIFYQKRLYPEKDFYGRKYRYIDRPYPPENSTEYLSSRLDVAPKILLAWLHHHYYRFCHESNIDKAALFLDNLSDIDTISINSIQSSQFYEMHSALDQLQLHLSIEGTVFSLYEDQSKYTKSSHKKIVTNQGSNVIKSSVENFSSNGNAELYSFCKPASLSMPKLVEDHEIILGYCSNQIMKHDLSRSDPTKILVDYLPYVSVMADKWSKLTNHSQVNGYTNEIAQICKDDEALKLIRILENLEIESKLDFDVQHEQLVDVIEGIEERSKIKSSKDQPE